MALSNRDLLAWTMIGEAGNQGKAGMQAVGSNILNRTYAGGYGSGISGVIMAPGQYSMWNDVTGYAGGSGGISQSIMGRTSPAKFAEAQGIADGIMSGQIPDNTGGSLNYYNPAVASPRWGIGSPGWTGTADIGAHTFGVSGGKSAYDSSSNPDDPRSGAGAYKPPYDNFSPSGLDTSSLSAPGSFSTTGEPWQGSTFPDDGSLKVTVKPEGTYSGVDNGQGDSGLTGDNVSSPESGSQGSPSDVPTAIVTSGNQQATVTANAAKTTAQAALSAAKTTSEATKAQTANETKLQGEQQGWASNWAVRIFLFIVGAIFLAGGLFLFGGQAVFQNKSA